MIWTTVVGEPSHCFFHWYFSSILSSTFFCFIIDVSLFFHWYFSLFFDIFLFFHWHISVFHWYFPLFFIDNFLFFSLIFFSFFGDVFLFFCWYFFFLFSFSHFVAPRVGAHGWWCDANWSNGFCLIAHRTEGDSASEHGDGDQSGRHERLARRALASTALGARRAGTHGQSRGKSLHIYIYTWIRPLNPHPLIGSSFKPSYRWLLYAVVSITPWRFHFGYPSKPPYRFRFEALMSLKSLSPRLVYMFEPPYRLLL